MQKCPNCNHPISNFKIWTLTNHNSITCSKCGKKLVMDKHTGSLIGGIGGGVGSLFLGLAIINENVPLFVVFFIIFLICIMWVSSRFTRLLIKDEN